MNIYNAFRTLWISLSLLLLGLNPGWAQETFTPKLLQEDLSHLKEILLGVSPKLTEDDRQRISDLVAFQKKELEEKSLNSMEFFNFLAEIDFQTKFDEHDLLWLNTSHDFRKIIRCLSPDVLMLDLEQLSSLCRAEFVCLANELFNILLLEKIIAVRTEKQNQLIWVACLMSISWIDAMLLIILSCVIKGQCWLANKFIDIWTHE